MAETQTTAPKRGRRETTMPHPVLVLQQELRTQETQRLFHRTYPATNSALLWLDAVVDKISQEAIDLDGVEDMRFQQVLDMIESRMDTCLAEMNEDLEKLLALRESHAVDLNIEHKNTITEPVEVNSPLSVKYLSLFSKFDEILEEMFALHFGSVLNRNQRKEVANRWRKEITKVSRVVIDSNTQAQDLNRKSKQRDSSDKVEHEPAAANEPQPDHDLEVKADTENPVKEVA